MKQVKCDRLRRLAERKKAGHADALLRWNQQAIPVAVLTLLDERDALERRVAELEAPHIFFEVHSHFEHTHWLWESDSTFVQKGRGFPWTTDDDIRSLMLEAYQEDLDKLVSKNMADGIAYGCIPVVHGKYSDEPPWEPVFSRARLMPLGPDPQTQKKPRPKARLSCRGATRKSGPQRI